MRNPLPRSTLLHLLHKEPNLPMVKTTRRKGGPGVITADGQDMQGKIARRSMANQQIGSHPVTEKAVATLLQLKRVQRHPNLVLSTKNN